MVRKGLVLVLSSLVFALFAGFLQVDESAAQKSIKLMFADMAAPKSVTAKCAEWWGSEVEKRTQGKVTLEYHWGASLVGAYEQLSSVKNNVIQVTPYYSGYHPDLAPIPLMALFPLVNKGSLESALKAADEFFRTNPEVQKEFQKNNVKYMNPQFGAHAYMWSKVPIRSSSDFQGLTVRAFGPWLTLFDALGSSMVSVPVPEIYNSLERGVVKATILYLTYGIGMNLFEVTDNLNVTNLGHNAGMPMVMNLDAWNKLPEDVKKIIEEINTGDAIPAFVEIDKENQTRELNVAKEKGMKISEFSKEEVEKLTAIAKEKVWDPYAKQLDGKGLKGSEVLADYLGLLKKHSAVQ